MALHDSKETYFAIDDIGADLRDMSAYLVSVDGLPGLRDLNPAEVLSSSSSKWHPTLERPVITLELLWDETVDTGPDDVFGLLRTHTAAVDYEYGPEGSAEGDIKYYGTCWVRNYQITSRVGSLVTARVEAPGDSVVGRTTFPA